MKKFVKIFSVVLALLLLLGGGLLIWQWDNVQALSMAVTKTREELSVLLAEKDAAVNDALEKLPITITPLTEEQEAQVASGAITEADAIDRMTGRMTAAGEPDPSKVLGGDEGRIAELVASMYLLRTTYTAKLAGMKDEAVAEYVALAEGARTEAAKMDIALRQIDRAGALEKECDEKVTAAVDELKILLKRVGGDETVIGEIQFAYASEKQIQKAYYMSLYPA